MSVSVVLPVLNEAAAIGDCLDQLSGCETLVVDGGSTDETLVNAGAATIVLRSEKGRARQMNVGAAEATGDVIVFLHADTRLPRNFATVLDEFMASDRAWGRFDVRLSGEHSMFRVIETMMNWRSRLTGICTGDQAIFVRKKVFEKTGGYAEIPLMEDIEISRRLRKVSRPYCAKGPVITSSRRWESKGMFRTIFQMWRLRLRYFLGASPEVLAREYYG